MGLPESTDISTRLIVELERRGDRAALLLERPGRVPTDVGSDVRVEDVRNLITLNGKYSKCLRSRYPGSRVFKAGLALPNNFFEREDSICDSQLVFTGRATDSKGFSDLLHWWSQSHLRKYGLRLKVNIVGTMPVQHAIAIELMGIELSALRGIDERGRSAGEALACIFPARVDHLPQSLLECMASRGLAVCTSIPGHSDVVRNARNGLLVQSGLRDLDALIWNARQNVRHSMNMRLAARHTAWEQHGSELSRALWGSIFGFMLP
jgi:glycosyltransferase involved in cell wall biosynthesis